MASTPPLFGSDPAPPTRSEDPELWTVADFIREIDPDGSTTANAIRNSIDLLLDGERTGRWDWKTLKQTEKTHMGTIVEIRLHHDLDFADGKIMDYEICGIEVDCKFSQKDGGWELPLESMGHICFVLTANDEKATWKAGLVRVQEKCPVSGAQLLGSETGNRDRKRKLIVAGRKKIVWLWGEDLTLPENLFQTLTPDERERIFTAKTGNRKKSSGQARLRELFRIVPGRIVRRSVVQTVARQDDSMKRARDCRKLDQLGKEGFLILGHQQNDPLIARALNLPVPVKGQFVAVRVHPADATDTVTAEIEGSLWRVARPDDPVVAAPNARPRKKQDDEDEDS